MHAAALLLLLLGGSAVAPAAPAGPVLQRLADMPTPRAAHSATPLRDGRVLFAGGCVADGCEEGIAGDAWLFDSADRRFHATGALQQARVGHRAVALADGSVLLFGGWTKDGATTSVERFDPKTGTFSRHGQLVYGRDGFTATPLADGTILIVGGYAGAMQRLASVEIYDPRKRRSLAITPMSLPRMAHTATRLADGRVLIAGGTVVRNRPVPTLLLYDPDTRTFRDAGVLAKARHKHAAMLRGDEVLIVGGAGTEEYASQFADTEIWNPRTEAVRPGPRLADARYKIVDAVAVLANGDVLVAGSSPVPEILSARGTAFRALAGRLDADLSFTTVTPLRSGQVLIAGGYDPRIRVSRAAWLYRQ